MAPSSDDETTQPLAGPVTSMHGSAPAEAATPPQGAATPPRARSGAASPSPSSPSPGTRLLSPPAAGAGAAGGAGDFASGASSPVVTRPRGSPPDAGNGRGTPATNAASPQAPTQSPVGPVGAHRTGSLAPGSPSAAPSPSLVPLNAGLDMPKKPLPNTVPVEKPRWYDLYSTRDATFKQMVHQVQEKLSGRRYRYISDRGFMDRMDMQYIREHQERERETEAMQIEEERAEFEYLKAQKKAEEEIAALARLRALAGTAGQGTGGPAAGGSAATAAAAGAGNNGMTFQPGSPLKASPAKASPVKIMIKGSGAAGPASHPSLPSPGPGLGSPPNSSKPAPTGVRGLTFESIFRGSGRSDDPSGLVRDEGGKKGPPGFSPDPVSAPSLNSGGTGGRPEGKANADSGVKGSPNSNPMASPSSGIRGFAAVARSAMEVAPPVAPPKVVLPKPFAPLDSPATVLQRSRDLGAASGIGAMLGWSSGPAASDSGPLEVPPSKRAKLSEPVSPGDAQAPGMASPPSAAGCVVGVGGSGSLGTGAGMGGLAAAFASPSTLSLQDGSGDCPLGASSLEPSDAGLGLSLSPGLRARSPAQVDCQAIVTPEAVTAKGSGLGGRGASGGGGMLFSLVAYGTSDSDSE